jgi:hypothetical protein
MASNVWIYLFRRFFIYQVCISKTATDFGGIVYFQTIAGGANEKLSRQGRD